MTNAIPNVPRELLERAVQIPSKASVEENHAAIVDRGRAQAEIRALLSSPSPAGVDGLEVVSNWVLFDAEADKPYIKKMLPEGFLAFFDCEEDARRAKANNPGTDYKRIDRVKAEDAQAIIDGLQEKIERLQFSLEVAKTDELSAAVYAETESIKHSLWDAEKERYKKAQRIGELEGLLREVRLPDDIGRMDIWTRIDAALSAGKEG